MKHLIPVIIYICMALAPMACQHTHISQMVKSVTEQPVDTTGYQSRTVRTQPFSAVEINCFSDVTFHQLEPGSECSVRLTASEELLARIKANVSSDGKLTLEPEHNYRTNDNEVAVVHLYAPAVNEFTVNGGKCLRLQELTAQTPVKMVLYGVGTINCTRLKAPEVVTRLEGVGSIDLEGIDTQRLRAELNGVGDIVLAGRAAQQHIMLEGTGHIDTDNLKK